MSLKRELVVFILYAFEKRLPKVRESFFCGLDTKRKICAFLKKLGFKGKLSELSDKILIFEK